MEFLHSTWFSESDVEVIRHRSAGVRRDRVVAVLSCPLDQGLRPRWQSLLGGFRHLQQPFCIWTDTHRIRRLRKKKSKHAVNLTSLCVFFLQKQQIVTTDWRKLMKRHDLLLKCCKDIQLHVQSCTSLCGGCESCVWVWGNGRVTAQSVPRKQHVGSLLNWSCAFQRALPVWGRNGSLSQPFPTHSTLLSNAVKERRARLLIETRPFSLLRGYRITYIVDTLPNTGCTSTTSCVPLLSNKKSTLQLYVVR